MGSAVARLSRRRFLALGAPAVLCASRALATARAAGPATLPTELEGMVSPFDRIREAYRPYMSLDDPQTFPMKVRSLAASPFGFWRGGKDLFFHWARRHCRAWLDRRDDYVAQQGDPHLGNVGTYLDGEAPFGTLAFGMVDFDDSHRAPFQLELLQGLVTLRLAARNAGLVLTRTRLDRLVQTMFEHYRRAAASDRRVLELLAGEPLVVKLNIEKRRRQYADELGRYVRDGRFLPAVTTKQTDLKDVMRPAMDRADEFAEGMAQAIARSPLLQRRFRLREARDLRAAIKDVARRTRPGSAGSQGQEKHFLLVERPLAEVDHDVIFYVKQQIPTAPERQRMVPADPRPPAQRCAEDIALLSRPGLYLSGWFALGERSYWITVREPWTEELDEDDIKTLEDLEAHARVWATAAGATHRGPGQAARIERQLVFTFSRQLVDLSRSCVAQLERDYASFTADRRLPPLLKKAEDFLAAAKGA